ncbi:Coenzyme F420 hydrogenase/dehydrogenase, beta subunit C-terminal domain [Clostridium perfringens]|uniref:Coenzyme F420 hydrogenase/dehydrogenase, beta subunit C-terminal domain n=1 Tax=Clostridium perfringens TaxID=1502 RepID=UPI00374F0871
MKKENIILFSSKNECCGCGACMNICPKAAITMKDDEYGFVYPEINNDICIQCELCKKVCAFQNVNQSNCVLKSYASAAVDKNIVLTSSSGGVFTSISEEFIKAGGIVYGCSMENTDNGLFPKHIRVSNINELKKLQGSKYVQSDLGNCFIELKNDLLLGVKVMFSGTPCQVAALYSFLGNNKTDLLYTVDIVCHGVPSINFFRDYISNLNKKVKGQIINFRFRDKSNGWRLQGAIDYIDNNGKKKTKLINSEVSSYFKLFLESSTYRDSCYNCKYTNKYRPGDITLGDYWGIENVHPEYLTRNLGTLEQKNGISCVLVNTLKGSELLNDFGVKLILKESSFSNVSAGNDQLNYPSEVNINRNKVLSIYRDGKYDAVEKWFNKRLGIKKYKILIIDFIKSNIKKLINY